MPFPRVVEFLLRIFEQAVRPFEFRSQNGQTGRNHQKGRAGENEHYHPGQGNDAAHDSDQ